MFGQNLLHNKNNLLSRAESYKADRGVGKTLVSTTADHSKYEILIIAFDQEALN